MIRNKLFAIIILNLTIGCSQRERKNEGLKSDGQGKAAAVSTKAEVDAQIHLELVESKEEAKKISILLAQIKAPNDSQRQVKKLAEAAANIDIEKATQKLTDPQYLALLEKQGELKVNIVETKKGNSGPTLSLADGDEVPAPIDPKKKEQDDNNRSGAIFLVTMGVLSLGSPPVGLLLGLGEIIAGSIVLSNGEKATPEQINAAKGLNIAVGTLSIIGSGILFKNAIQIANGSHPIPDPKTTAIEFGVKGLIGLGLGVAQIVVGAQMQAANLAQGEDPLANLGKHQHAIKDLVIKRAALST